MRIKPYEWQLPLIRYAVDSMVDDRVFISGYPTGSGKTVIALAAALEMEISFLVVCPKAARTQWRRTAEAMDASHLMLDVINPEKISKKTGCDWYKRGKGWSLPPNTMVIWDEPHRSASGVEGLTTRALAELKAYPRVLLHAMTATLADSPLKLRALGWWTGLHNFNRGSFYNWCRENGCLTVMFGDRSVFQFTKSPKEAAHHMANIRRAMGTKFMAFRADDIPGFPTQTVDTLMIDLSTRDTKEIESAYQDMSERMKTMAKNDMAEIGKQRERVEFILAEALADITCNFVEDGNSVVIFFNYTEPRRRFETMMHNRSIRVSSIHGMQKDDHRQADIDAFQKNEVPVISVMVEAGGAAISLHDELKQRPRVSLLLPPYNAASAKQCLGRIRRCEGTHATQYFVLAAGTIQEKVAKTLQAKLNNIDTLNDTDLLP